MGLNMCTFTGRLVADPDVRTVGENTKVASFTVAVDKRFKPKDDNMPTADFIPVTVWRKKAELAENYLHKGKEVAVAGPIETYTWDKEDGTKGYGFRVNADEIHFIGKREDSNGSGNASVNKGKNQTNAYAVDPAGSFNDGFMPDIDENGDDLPF